MSVHRPEWGLGTMRKKTTWAASLVRKQLQTCCQHETLSLDTHEPDDFSVESFELPPEIFISSPVKDPSTFPSLFRRKSFNVTHVRNLLTTPESQTPYRKSVDSSIPLFAGSAFKPRRLQYVRSSANLVPRDAATPLPLPLPPRGLGASSTPKAKVHPKSGPLPLLRHSSFKEGSALEMGSNSPVKLKKYLSGPLPRLQLKVPLAGSLPSPPRSTIKLISMSGKAKELRGGGGPSPTNRFMRVKSSAQALFPTVATSKLPGMVTQGTLKKAAQLAKVTPVLERKGSRGSRASRDGNPRTTPVGKTQLVMSHDVLSPKLGRMRSSARERVRAAVKIQAAVRGYRARKRYVVELARANNVSGELTDEDEQGEEAPSISTRMSRTNPPKRKSTARGSRGGMDQVSKSWNGSLRTAQDCQAIMKSKQEAALKRERAMEYAMSRRNWKTGSRSQKSTTPASWVVDNTFPDKPGWVWNWLERAARMGAHNSPNRIFDNDFDDHETPVSESLSVKSTVGVCTTELGSAAEMEHLTVPMTYPWPLSLRQQHAAGLLHPKKARPSPLKKSDISGLRERTGSELKTRKSRPRHPSEAQEVCRSREELSSTTGSCVTCQMSDEFSLSKPRFGVRKLKFTEEVGLVAEEVGLVAEEDAKARKEGGDVESVGSCVGPLPSLQYRLSSPFAGPRPRTSSQSGLQQQMRMSNPNSLRDAMKVNPQAHGYSQSHHVQRQQVSVALSDDDSAGTTAASVRRPFWRP